MVTQLADKTFSEENAKFSKTMYDSILQLLYRGLHLSAI